MVWHECCNRHHDYSAATSATYRPHPHPHPQIQLVEDGRGNFLFYGAGVHLILDPFYTVHERARDFGNPTAGMGVSQQQGRAQGPILHGDRTIVVVEQVRAVRQPSPSPAPELQPIT